VVSSNASQYLAMGVTDENVVVIVYYDQTDQQLKLVYSTTTAGGSTAQGIDLSSPTDAVYWSTPKGIGPVYNGWYVSLFIQNDGTSGTPDPIHIASHDTENGDLRYIYLTSFAILHQKLPR